MRKFTIAIDGPSGAGKSSMADALAEKLSILHLDTGAMYRALGCEVMRRGLPTDDAKEIEALLPSLEMSVAFHEGKQRTFINGCDMSPFIRSPEASMAASNVSKISAVRRWLVGIQQQLAEKESFVLDGRDIGTVVLPAADLKFFLAASPEIRAERRFLELHQAGAAVDYGSIYEEMLLRDAQDSGREDSPTRQAEDAIYIDSSQLSPTEVLERMLRELESRCVI